MTTEPYDYETSPTNNTDSLLTHPYLKELLTHGKECRRELLEANLTDIARSKDSELTTLCDILAELLSSFLSFYKSDKSKKWTRYFINKTEDMNQQIMVNLIGAHREGLFSLETIEDLCNEGDDRVSFVSGLESDTESIETDQPRSCATDTSNNNSKNNHVSATDIKEEKEDKSTNRQPQRQHHFFRSNSPSLILTRVTDERLLSCNRDYFDLKWKIWCDLVCDDEISPKLCCENISSIDLKGKTGLTISFCERPKRSVLDEFVASASQYGLGCRMFVFVENYSPPWKTASPVKMPNTSFLPTSNNATKDNFVTPPTRKGKTTKGMCRSYGSSSFSSPFVPNYSPIHTDTTNFSHPSLFPSNPLLFESPGVTARKIANLEAKMEQISALLAQQMNWMQTFLTSNG